jgi:hypothetical protein
VGERVGGLVQQGPENLDRPVGQPLGSEEDLALEDQRAEIRR